MIPFIFLAIAGAALLAAGIINKMKYRLAMIVSGAVILVVGTVMVVLTLYFAWAVGNDAPGTYDASNVEVQIGVESDGGFVVMNDNM